MPYIKQERRKIFNKKLEKILNNMPVEKGDLTYCAYKLGLEYMKAKELTFKKEVHHYPIPPPFIFEKLKIDKGSYQIMSDTIAALEDAAYELRRRFLDDYEQRKRFENGDIE